MVLLVFLCTGPLYWGNEWLSVANLIGISIIAAMGLNILTGLTGQISLGQGAFMGVGAYTLMLLMNYLGFSFNLSWGADAQGFFHNR